MKPNAEINLTSLLDVAFVLLIAFMIVAPSLKYGVDLQLPSMKEGAPQLSTDQQGLSTIVITRALASASKGGVKTFLLDGEAVELNEMEQRLLAKKKKLGDKLSVEIQADRDVPYEAFVQAIGAVRRAGVEAVGLPVDTDVATTVKTSSGK
ncbi:MAG: ExbD/TolR family protein [Candidatus Sumerlaeaceae bacterium]